MVLTFQYLPRTSAAQRAYRMQARVCFPAHPLWKEEWALQREHTPTEALLSAGLQFRKMVQNHPERNSDGALDPSKLQDVHTCLCVKRTLAILDNDLRNVLWKPMIHSVSSESWRVISQPAKLRGKMSHQVDAGPGRLSLDWTYLLTLPPLTGSSSS